jgi:hypothetical protein
MDNKYLEIVGPQEVEILIRGDGKTIWVMVDGICQLRIGQIGNLKFNGELPTQNLKLNNEDRRKQIAKITPPPQSRTGKRRSEVA